MTVDRAASVLAKLKSVSREKDVPFQQILNLFCQEEFVRRLSISEHRDKLILKGGYFIYAISNLTGRPTVDADYLLQDFSNDEHAVFELVQGILSIPTDNDYVVLRIIGLEKISEAREYHGIRASFSGQIGRTRTPFSIDFGVGDVIFPSAEERKLAVLLPEFEIPIVLTYSIESTIAEKLDAIIALMQATGRMKDFYDIYYLATQYDIAGRTLQIAIRETLKKRSRQYDGDIIKEISQLRHEPVMLKRWDMFTRKVLGYDLSFELVVSILTDLVGPPMGGLIEEGKFERYWSHHNLEYQEKASADDDDA